MTPTGKNMGKKNLKRVPSKFLEPILVMLAITALFSLLNSNLAYAESSGGIGNLTNPLPAGVIYPTPVAIVYPGFNIAAGVNAAALTSGKRATAGLLAAAPPLQSGDPTSYIASIATSSNRLGWSVGYLGSQATSGLSHGMFAGVGFSLAPLSFGVGLRDTDMSGGFNPNVDFGSKFELGKDWAMAAVIYNLDQSPGASFGLGYSRRKKEAVEVNFLMPTFSSSDYAVTVAATVYTGRFGTTFRTSYFLTSKTFSHTLGGLIWVTPNFNFLLQLTSPRTLTAGITYVF